MALLAILMFPFWMKKGLLELGVLSEKTQGPGSGESQAAWHPFHQRPALGRLLHNWRVIVLGSLLVPFQEGSAPDALHRCGCAAGPGSPSVLGAHGWARACLPDPLQGAPWPRRFPSGLDVTSLVL